MYCSNVRTVIACSVAALSLLCADANAAFVTQQLALQSIPISQDPISRKGLDGDYVTWVEQHGNDRELHWHNLATQANGIAFSDPLLDTRTDVDQGRIVFTVWSNESFSVDLMLYDIATQQTSTLANEPWLESRPDIDGDWVVYNDYKYSNGPFHELGVEVLALNLSTMATHTVASSPDADFVGDLVDGRVLLYAHGPDQARIVDLETGDIINIGPEPEMIPRTDGETVVWHSDDGRPSSQWGIHGRNIDTLEDIPGLPQDSTIRMMPDISKDYIVWSEESPRGDHDIYGFDRRSETVFPISTTLADERSPVVDGQTVVWSALEEGNENFLSLYAATIPEPASVVLLVMGGLALLRRR